MPKYLYKTRGNSSPQNKPRVYFTCHSDDFESYFNKICEDIFKTHDCAIYYTEDMTEIIPDEDKPTDLGSMNLFVVPVTFRLLSKPNRAMDDDLAYAKKEHIAILPFMMESGIDMFYSRPDKFGELQYINPYSHDLTEISYEEKLKKYLESVLISEEIAKRVRAAFDAYIFLSYRKKDRRYANELMRLIHAKPEFRDIAIWYDEFLTPGESFNENIGRMLKESKLFTLLVTPNLLEKPNGKPNYVMEHEYPDARDAGMDILPAEMEETDKDTLNAEYIGIPECVCPSDDEAFRERLVQSLGKIARTENDDDPEHNYLIGLAYLNGIDVETNPERGLSLIASAADTELPEAMIALANIYHDGISVQINYSEELKWRERVYEYEKKTHGEENPASLLALRELAQTHHYLHNRVEFMSLNEKVYSLQCKVLGEDHPDSIVTLSHLATAYYQFTLYDRAIEKAQKAYDLSLKLWGKENDIAICALETLAATNNIKGDHVQALSLYKEAYDLRCKIYGEKDQTTLTALNNIAVTYGKLGNTDKELELLTSVSCLQCEIFGNNHPSTATCFYNLAYTYEKKGEREKAYSLYKTVYEIYCQYIGDKALDTLAVLENLSRIYWSMFISAKESSSNEEYIFWISNYEKIASHAFEYDKFEKAIEFYEKLLSIQSRSDIISVFDEEKMASIYGNLGHSYKETGDYSNSIKFYSKAIELLERLYIWHPETHIRELAQDYYGIGISFKNTGKNREAVNAFYKAIELNEKIYALFYHLSVKEHTEAYVATFTIGLCYSELNCAKEAIANYTKVFELAYEAYGPNNFRTNYIREVLQKECCKEFGDAGNLKLAVIEYEISVKVLGKDHPETLTTMHNLAYTYGEFGDHRKELELYEKVYKQRCEVHGEKHPYTLKSLNNLAWTYGDLEDYAKAAELTEKLYRLQCEVLGEDDPKTLTALQNLAWYHCELGHIETAIEMFERVYVERKKVLGEKDRTTMTTLSGLSKTYVKAGRYADAVQVLETVYIYRCETLGEDHSDTLRVLEELEQCRKQI